MLLGQIGRSVAEVATPAVDRLPNIGRESWPRVGFQTTQLAEIDTNRTLGAGGRMPGVAILPNYPDAAPAPPVEHPLSHFRQPRANRRSPRKRDVERTHPTRLWRHALKRA